MRGEGKLIDPKIKTTGQVQGPADPDCFIKKKIIPLSPLQQAGKSWSMILFHVKNRTGAPVVLRLAAVGAAQDGIWKWHS